MLVKRNFINNLLGKRILYYNNIREILLITILGKGNKVNMLLRITVIKYKFIGL